MQDMFYEHLLSRLAERVVEVMELEALLKAKQPTLFHEMVRKDLSNLRKEISLLAHGARRAGAPEGLITKVVNPIRR